MLEIHTVQEQKHPQNVFTNPVDFRKLAKTKTQAMTFYRVNMWDHNSSIT